MLRLTPQAGRDLYIYIYIEIDPDSLVFDLCWSVITPSTQSPPQFPSLLATQSEHHTEEVITLRRIGSLCYLSLSQQKYCCTQDANIRTNSGSYIEKYCTFKGLLMNMWLHSFVSLNICLAYPFNEEMFQIIEKHSIHSPFLFDQKPDLKEII